MVRLIILLLLCLSANAQTLTVDRISYVISDEAMLRNPNTYLHMFFVDAGERGHDVTSARGGFNFFEGTGSVKGYSRRDAACRGEFNIGLQEHYWDNFDVNSAFISGATNLFEQRRFLAYHELGHALFRFNHTCQGRDVIVGGSPLRLIDHDIMFSSRSCGNIRYSYTSVYSWIDQLDRMFSPGYQTTHPCNTSKGVIYDY